MPAQPRDVGIEISRGSVRKAMPERLSVVWKMLRVPVMTAPPKCGSRKYFWGKSARRAARDFRSRSECQHNRDQRQLRC